jgi:hypothetical protein
MAGFLLLAVREGFEPSIGINLYTLSRRAPSTTRTPHQNLFSSDHCGRDYALHFTCRLVGLRPRFEPSIGINLYTLSRRVTAMDGGNAEIAGANFCLRYSGYSTPRPAGPPLTASPQLGCTELVNHSDDVHGLYKCRDRHGCRLRPLHRKMAHSTQSFVP